MRPDMLNPLEDDRQIRGVRAGAVVFIGIAAANLGNYVFHLLSARSLGPGSYGDVATLTALTGLIALPLGGVQVFVARHVAAFSTRREQDRLRAFVRASVRTTVVAALVLTAMLAALAPLLARLLSISSLTAVVMTALVTVPAVLVPVVLGVAQGLQRFGIVAVGLGAAPVIRVAFVAVFLAAGFGVAGAMGATLLATLVGLAVPMLLLGTRNLGRGAAAHGGPSRREAAELVPVVAGLLAITVLSTADIAVAKTAFDDHTAGVYGAASLAGRVILYLPAAIVLVLLPKVSARVAARQSSDDILSGSLVVTSLFCLAATALYAFAPSLVVQIAFGSEFDQAAPLLWLFGLAMSGFALLSVLLTYHLGHGSQAMSWLLLGGALAQLVGFVLLHDSPRQLLVVSIIVATTLLVVHEVALDASFTRIFRSRPAWFPRRA